MFAGVKRNELKNVAKYERKIRTYLDEIRVEASVEMVEMEDEITGLSSLETLRERKDILSARVTKNIKLNTLTLAAGGLAGTYSGENSKYQPRVVKLSNAFRLDDDTSQDLSEELIADIGDGDSVLDEGTDGGMKRSFSFTIETEDNYKGDMEAEEESEEARDALENAWVQHIGQIASINATIVKHSSASALVVINLPAFTVDVDPAIYMDSVLALTQQLSRAVLIRGTHKEVVTTFI